jgi:cell division protein ZapA
VFVVDNRAKVTIFGNTYTIQGDAPAEYISQLAGYVNEKMEDVQRSISTGSPLQIAILAALNIADEYFQVGDRGGGGGGDMGGGGGELVDD